MNQNLMRSILLPTLLVLGAFFNTSSSYAGFKFKSHFVGDLGKQIEKVARDVRDEAFHINKAKREGGVTFNMDPISSSFKVRSENGLEDLQIFL